MPEAKPDDFRVLTLGDEHRRMSVAEVVKPERLADRGSDRGEPSASPEVGATKRPALGSGEDEPVRTRWPPTRVPSHLLGKELR